MRWWDIPEPQWLQTSRRHHDDPGKIEDFRSSEMADAGHRIAQNAL